MKRVITLVLVSIVCFLLIIAGGIVFDRLTVKSESIVVTPTPLPVVNLSSEKLWELVNNWRVSQNLPMFTYDSRLCEIADSRLSEVKTNWSHDGFREDFELLRSKLKYKILGENLANVYSSEESTLSSWLDSPSHKDNLDDPYTHSCIKAEGSYAVQIFAKY